MSFVTAVLTNPLLLTAVAAEAEVEHAAVPLPLPLWAYPTVAFVLLLALGIVLWSFRDVANRHSAKAAAFAAAHGGDTGHSGH
ncbi:hypothetical protein [Cryobacterium psychrophilum]|uniref:Uncharacterized protein n=1 Tax=Cryobacterium psychrophilum TaxID=41988 RepID=A0A4Y8KLD7_9MICO|nr:hypothetical protein [Cryobacterium psychrophilum]TDW31347.1 hypothetical protein EDD25_3155 [Cryobacterium psychrophilum]TFD78377.1 hypothetical protein E3T53_09210 [Cryobacterium psychrophilum]